VGVLVRDGRRVFFEYDPGFLETGWSLSPFRIPFRSGLHEHSDHAFGPLPGLFDDSLPDGWGRLLMDRHFRKLGRNPSEVDAFERLTWLGTGTMGALTYHPPTEREGIETSPFDLAELARQSREILDGSATEVLPRLLRAGGSPGGARPKVLVGVDPASSRIVSGEDEIPAGFEPWLVKFASRTDRLDSGVVEYAYARMAVAAGIDLPAVRLFEDSGRDRVFGVRRFDRDGGRRFHVHTFGNLIHADFRVPSMDYLDLLKVTAVLTRDDRDRVQAFRRMVFNVLAHNRDDHVKNFAFLLDDGTGAWRLSPAYDLIFAAGPGGEHSMTVAGEGRHPDRTSIRTVAARTGIPDAVCGRVLDEVAKAVLDWPRFAEEAGVTAAVRDEIGATFPGV
jgi:serine/threonine-protein kinase HipA